MKYSNYIHPTNSFYNITQLYIYETKHFNYVTLGNIEGVV